MVGAYPTLLSAVPAPLLEEVLCCRSDRRACGRYGHKNGFVPDSEFDFLWNNCSSRFPVSLARGAWGTVAQEEQTLNAETSAACTLANRKFLAQTSRGFSQNWPLAWINDLTLFGPAAVVPFTQPGSLNYMTAQYMMRADVKAALHLEQSPATSWPGPGAGWSYRSDYVCASPPLALQRPQHSA